MVAAFDTLKFKDRLTASGFSEEQARGMTAAWSEALGEQLATKADLELAVERLRGEIRVQVQEAERRMSRRLYAAMGALAVLITIYEFIGR